MRHFPSHESTASVCGQVQGEEFPTVETFMAKYRLDAPAALERIKVKETYRLFGG